MNNLKRPRMSMSNVDEKLTWTTPCSKMWKKIGGHPYFMERKLKLSVSTENKTIVSKT